MKDKDDRFPRDRRLIRVDVPTDPEDSLVVVN